MSSTSAAVQIVETERLILREMNSEDAEFIFELLNAPAFIKYIGDRGVRSAEDARRFIEERYRESYRRHGYGLYAVELKSDGTPVGMCGFVRREMLSGPDIGFAFLPQYEGKGFGFESASAMIRYGREELGFEQILAITSKDNSISIKLLTKLGFRFVKLITTPEGEELKLFQI